VYGRYYQRGTVCATVAPGGFGKTTLALTEAIAMATARNLLGEQPSERVRVWYHNGEDGRQEVMRRVVAICKFYEIPQEELREWLFITSSNEIPLKVATGYDKLVIDNDLIELIRAEIIQSEVSVAILDPLVTLHQCSEQDNSRMDTVVRIFQRLSDTLECSISLKHHTRKLSINARDRDYEADDMRGASSIKDAVRCARMLNHMSKEEALRLAIPESERLLYFRIDTVKGNNQAPGAASWGKFVTVELANGDEIGIVAPWSPPGLGERTEAQAAMETVADRLFLDLLRQARASGEHMTDRKQGRYAPRAFAEDKDAQAAGMSEKAFEGAMRRLKTAGRIKLSPYGPPSRGKTHLEEVV
jgi:hypothetical protein